jgi:predicted RNA binding protein YcfA (HicA-like mRNA interferase family)
MPKSPRWTAADAESALIRAGFSVLRAEGSHRIYGKGGLRVVVPFHAGMILHPRIIKQVIEAIEAGAGLQ